MTPLSSLSIRQRHMLIIGIVLAGFIAVGFTAQYSNQQLMLLNSTQLNLETLKHKLLTLRRHEKDFMSRKDLKYVDRFNSEHQQAIAITEQLIVELQQEAIDSQKVSEIKGQIQSYGQSFIAYTKLQTDIGLDHKSGLYGSLRKSIHGVEQVIGDKPDLMAQMLMLRRHEKDFMLRRLPKYIGKFDNDIDVMRSLLIRNGLNSSVDKLDIYQKEFTQLTNAEKAIGLSHKEGLHGQLRQSAHDLETLFEEQSQTLASFIEQKILQYRVIFIVLLSCLAAASLTAVILLSKSISLALDKLIKHVMALIKADDDNIDIKAHNELEVLENAFNQLNTKLVKAVKEIKQSANNISEVTNEIVTATNNVNDSSSNQHCLIEQTATAMEEISNSIHEVSRNANNTSEFVATINSRLCDATDISATAQSAIESLKDELGNSVQAISKLQTTSTNIDALLDSIQAIADQTNLLALNAAIESARAGEHGRGFSVVADEVRSLSSKTSAATDEVRKTLDEFKDVINSVVDTVNASSEKGEDGHNHANNAIQMMREMTQKVAEISMMNLQIASSVEEQSTAVESMNGHIHSIFESSLTVRDANNDTSVATEKLSRVVGEINQTASVFST